MRSEKTDDHHVIPTSIGGSDHHENRIAVPKRQHSQFHEWAEHRPPCFAIRWGLLHILGGKYTPEPETLRTIMQITTMREWDKLYIPQAFSNIIGINAGKKAKRSLYNQQSFWYAEQALIQQLLGKLANGGMDQENEPMKTGMLLRSMRANSCRDALCAFLDQEHQNKLCWSNPMQEVTRDALRETFELMPYASKILKITGRVRVDFEQVLHEQSGVLHRIISNVLAEENGPVYEIPVSDRLAQHV